MSDFDEFERQLSENKQGEYECSLLTNVTLNSNHLHNIVIIYIYNIGKSIIKQQCVVCVGIVSDFTDLCAVNALNIL